MVATVYALCMGNFVLNLPCKPLHSPFIVFVSSMLLNLILMMSVALFAKTSQIKMNYALAPLLSMTSTIPKNSSLILCMSEST